MNKNIINIFTIVFLCCSALYSSEDSPQKSSDPIFFQYITIVLSAFVGSTLGYYFTRKKFQKDQLFSKKMITYQELIASISEFKYSCIKQEDIDTLSVKWFEIEQYLDKAYLFIPDNIYDKFRPLVATTNSKLSSYIEYLSNLEADKSKVYYFDFTKSSKKIPWEPTNELISIQIFSPFLVNIPELIDDLKNDIDFKWKFIYLRYRTNRHYKKIEREQKQKEEELKKLDQDIKQRQKKLEKELNKLKS